MVPVCNLWTLASQVQTPYRYLVISHVTVSKVSPRCLILEVWSIWNLMSKRNCNIYTVQEICLSHVSKHFFQNFHYMALFHHALLSWKRMAFSYFLKIFIYFRQEERVWRQGGMHRRRGRERVSSRLWAEPFHLTSKAKTESQMFYRLHHPGVLTSNDFLLTRIFIDIL